MSAVTADPVAIAERLLVAVRAEAPDARYAEEPGDLGPSYGPGALGLAFDGTDLPPAWQGPRTLRLAADQAAADREVAALRVTAAAGLAVPGLRASWDAVASPLGVPAVVTTRPAGTDLLDLVAADPDRATGYLAALAEAHAALHEVPAGDDLAAVPVADPRDLPPGAGERERAWVESHAPAPAPAVLCHGWFQPLVASGDALAGEPLEIRSWSAATRAEPEYDVAFTLTAFWSAPYYAGTRTERAGLKMVRDMLANVYRNTYEARRPLDPDRVQFWQCVHALRGSLDPDTPADLAPALAKRFWKLARSVP